LFINLKPTLQVEERSVREKREVMDHYTDDHCLDHFSVESNTIIRTKDSQENGAVFLNDTEVDSMARCLHICCGTPLCNVAVFGEGNSCFLFDCGPPDALKCQFTSSEDFASAVLDVDRHRFDMSVASNQRGHSDQLTNLKSPVREPKTDRPRLVQEDCGQWQFSCGSGDCIATYDVCNGIPQCRDASDENEENCGRTTFPPQPPPAVQSPSLAQAQQRQDMVPSQSYFQHRNGLQLSAAAQSAAASRPDLNGFQQQQQDFNYPKDPYSGGLVNPVYGVGMQVRPGFQQYPPAPPPGNQFGLFNQFPPQQQQQNQYPAPFQPPPYNIPPPQQQQEPPRPTIRPPPPPATARTTEKPTRKIQKVSTIPPAIIETKSEAEKYEEALIASLGSELQPLSMPGIAVFTLVIGILLTACIITLLVCRIRRSRGSFRRKLTHEADGDFLVNGMYL